MALEPSLWGTLPQELLHLVFAQFPAAGIGQLRVLSKEWKRNIDCKDSEFNKVLGATIHLNMFALLHSSRASHIYDVQANKWHLYGSDGTIERVETWDGAHGGLMWFLSNWSWKGNEPRFCYVINLLTKQKILLPPLLNMAVTKSNNLKTVVKTVKLIVDEKTKEYKVFIVGSIGDGGKHFFAQVYDSRIKEWKFVEATQGHIIGWDYKALDMSRYFPCGVNVYNCANGTMQHFTKTDIAPGLEVEVDHGVLVEDHLFLLHKEASSGPTDLLEDGASMPKYCIFEFHLPEKSNAWVKLRVYNCDSCKGFRSTPHRSFHLKLLGCKGFLVVYDYDSMCYWLYNLSTCEWRTLPSFRLPSHPRMMCTISWSAFI